MILIVFGVIAILAGGYLLYYGLSSLLSETEGTAGSRTARTLSAIAGAAILLLGVAMLFVR